MAKSVFENNFDRLEKLGITALILAGAEHHKAQSPGYMDLSYNLLESNPIRSVFSLTHYYEQNGDLMHDPDMQLRVDFELRTVEALTFQQDSLGVYQEVYPQPGQVRPALKRDLNNFLSSWLTNLLNQGFKFDAAATEPEPDEYDDSEERAAAYEAMRDREIGPEFYDRLSPDPEQMFQQINATIEITLNVPADKDRIEYHRMFDHTLERALSDHPTMFSFESLRITSLMEEAEIFGNAEQPSFNVQQSKEQNIAAIMAALHQHEGAALVYQNIGPHVGGYPGVHDLVIDLAAKLTDWEKDNFGEWGGAYEENYTDWASITNGIAQALVEEAQGAGFAFAALDTKALVEQVLLSDYAARVDYELRKVFALGIDDVGLDDDAIARARNKNQDPVDYAHWLGEKYDMDAIYPAQKPKPPSGKM